MYGKGLEYCPELQGLWTTLPQRDKPVHKIGRASGPTTGMYSGLKSCLIAEEVVNGVKKTVMTMEHTATMAKGPFIKSGDSGCLAFCLGGTVSGLFFGGSNDGRIGYFTSTRDLLADIRMVTGVAEDEIRLKYLGLDVERA